MKNWNSHERRYKIVMPLDSTLLDGLSVSRLLMKAIHGQAGDDCESHRCDLGCRISSKNFPRYSESNNEGEITH